MIIHKKQIGQTNQTLRSTLSISIVWHQVAIIFPRSQVQLSSRIWRGIEGATKKNTSYPFASPFGFVPKNRTVPRKLMVSNFEPHFRCNKRNHVWVPFWRHSQESCCEKKSDIPWFSPYFLPFWMAINWGVNPPILPFSVSFLVESLRFHGKVRKPWFSLGKNLEL